MGFPQSVADEIFVKCGRHCCLCGKYAGQKMELHHIKQAADGGEDTVDNCIPLCLDCHAEVASYNPRHPKGRKYTETELKGHRDRVFKKYWVDSVQDDRSVAEEHLAEITAQNDTDSERHGPITAVQSLSKIASRIPQNERILKWWNIEEEVFCDATNSCLNLSLDTDPSNICFLDIENLIQKEGSLQNQQPGDRTEYEKKLSEIKEEIETEFNIMEKLEKHPNIVQILEHTFNEWEQDGMFGCDALVRYEPLTSLRKQINRGKLFTEDEILKIGLDISAALMEYHDNQIVHSDICLDSIYINQYGMYKLAQFDFSDRIKQKHILKYEHSRPFGYTAPEQILGEVDSRSDLYSLGIVMHQLISQSRLPPTPLYRFRMDTNPPVNANAALLKVIMKACAPSLEDRYATAQELHTALEQFRSKQYITPSILQRKQNECGAASLAMIFAYWGKALSLDQLCAETRVSPDGCNAGDIMRTAKRFGMDCHGYRRGVDGLIKTPKPCIIHWDFCCFKVLESIKDGCALLNDPVVGHRVISLEELDEGFTGVVLTFSPTDQW